MLLDCPGACAVFRPTGPNRFFIFLPMKKFYVKRACSLAVFIGYLTNMSKVWRIFKGTVNTFANRSPQLIKKSRCCCICSLGIQFSAELFLLRARSLRLLATLDARAFIMLTLAELGKRTRLGARTLKTAQRAVNGLVFLNADLRHSFPSLRAFHSGGTLCTALHATAHKTVRILYLFLPSVSTTKFSGRPD